jgi:hypothetical protein
MLRSLNVLTFRLLQANVDLEWPVERGYTF